MPRPHSPSVTSAATLLQAQFGEDAHQHHDGHHATDDVHDEVCAVPLLVALALGDGSHGLAGVGPDWRVVVGADALVQPLLTELATEAVETGPAAVQEDPGVAVEGWVPLAHHIIVALATRPTNRGIVLIIRIPAADGSGQTRLWRSVLGRVFVAGCRLVGWDDKGVSRGYGRGGRVLGEGRVGGQEEEKAAEEKTAAGVFGGCHVARRVLRPKEPLAEPPLQKKFQTSVNNCGVLDLFKYPRSKSSVMKHTMYLLMAQVDRLEQRMFHGSARIHTSLTPLKGDTEPRTCSPFRAKVRNKRNHNSLRSHLYHL